MNFFNKLIVSSLYLFPKSIIKIFSKKYVAGETHSEALRVIKNLNINNQYVTIDILGEHTNNIKECLNITNEYIQLLKEINKKELKCNLSIKPSHIGSDINYTPGNIQ